MPELPEVETIKQQLASKIVGKKLNGKEITGLRRRTKILIIDFKNDSSLLFHLKLTGQLIFKGKPSKYTRKVFNFEDGCQLIFNDLRRFGWYRFVKNTDKIEKGFGPEALEIGLKEFKESLKKRPKSKIKTLLMDQKFIAGIGNIYSDEILFASKVLPRRRVKTLKNKEIELIFRNIRKILKKAIKFQGSSVEHYLDACGKEGSFVKHHKVYKKENQPCFACKTKIKRIKIGGRSAHYCPKCQK